MAKKDFAISLRLQSQQFKSGIQAVQQQLNSFKSFATKAFVGLGVAEFGKKLIKAASNLETLDTNLGTLLGSMDKGVKLRKELQKYGQSTPYDTDGLVRATQTMLGYGVAQEKVMPIMRQLGDVAMGDANKLQSLALAYSQMTAAGKVAKQDMNQMANAGFGFNQVAQSMGISVGELTDRISKGKVHVNDIEKALKDATSEGGLFFNSAINGSSTFEGVVSNLEESVTSTLANIGQEILPTAKEVANGISSLIESMSGTIQSVAKTIGNLLSFIVSNARSVGVAIASIFVAPKLLNGIQIIRNTWKTTQNQIVADALAAEGQIERFEEKHTDVAKEEADLRKQISEAEKNEKLKDAIELTNKLNQLQNERTAYEKLKANERTQLETAHNVQLNNTKGIVATLKGAFVSLGAAIKTAFATTIFTAALAALGAIVEKAIELYSNWKKASNSLSDFKKKVESIDYDDSVINLEKIYDSIKRSKNQTAEIKKYQKELNDKYGISITQADGKLKKEQDITSEIQKQIDLLKKRAEVDALSSELTEIYKREHKFQQKYGNDNNDKGSKVLAKVSYKDKDGKTHYRNPTANETAEYNAKQRLKRPGKDDSWATPFRQLDISTDMAQHDNDEKAKAFINNRLSQIGDVSDKPTKTITTTPTSTTGGDSTTTKKGHATSTKSNPIADANADYAKAIDTAKAKLDAKLITEDDYYNELGSAINSLIDSYLNNGKTVEDATKKLGDDFTNYQKRLNQKFKDNLEESNPYFSGNTSNRNFDKSFELPSNDVYIPRNKEEKEEAEKQAQIQAQEEQLSKVNDRIQEEIQYYHELQKAKDEAIGDEQVQAVKDALGDVSATLGTLKNQATNLNDAIRLSKYKEQIDNINKDLQGNYSIFDEIAKKYTRIGGYVTEIQSTYQGIVGLAQDWQSVSNAEGFEKILAIFDALFGTLEKIQSIFEGWDKFHQLLESAKTPLPQAPTAASTPTTGATIGTPQAVGTVADDGTEKAIEQQTALQDAVQQTSTVKQAAAAADAASQATTVAASQGTVAANTAEMTTSMTAAGGEASKQAAKLPFPANIIAIASIVSMIVGLIATLKGAFASGGIIQGAHKHGDMQLARVNAGEMILNTNQQKHLFNALNSASLASPLSSNGGNVTFRLRGQDLIGSINNYKSKMGKSTI